MVGSLFWQKKFEKAKHSKICLNFYEKAKAKAEESSRLMVHLANRATREYPQIKKWLFSPDPQGLIPLVS